MRTFLCPGSPFFDLVPYFFGYAIGDGSFFFGSHHVLPSSLIGLPARPVSCMQAQTIACACMHVRARSLVAAVYTRMQKFACVCTLRGDVSNEFRCAAPP